MTPAPAIRFYVPRIVFAGMLLTILAGFLPAQAQTLTAWGSNAGGQTTIPALPGRAIAVSAGNSHSLVLMEDGTVAAWGGNSSGQSVVPDGLNGVTAIAAGTSHSLALKSDGTVVVWGKPGQSSTVVQPVGLTGAVAISAGHYSLALKNDGTVFEWSASGTSTGRVPSTLSGVTAISSGHFHALALRSDGSVVTWGSTYSSGTAVVPAGMPLASAISAGSNHSLALLRDGTVRAWGDNSSGQATVPAGLQDVIAISAGSYHSLALKADGTLVGWGRNYDGEAQAPAGMAGVLTIAAGGSHNLTLTGESVNEPPVILSVPAAATNAAGTAGSTLLFQHRIVATGSPVLFAASGLPAGLTLDPLTGIIAGVATEPGTFAVTLSASNSAGTGTQAFHLWVQGAPHFLSLPSVLSLSIIQDLREYVSNHPTQWSATGLPPGLAIDGTTGAITGKPSMRGLYSPRISFANAYGQSETSWQVEISPVVVIGGSNIAGLGRVTAMATDNNTFRFLRDDGTVAVPGQAGAGAAALPGFQNVVAIAAGWGRIAGLKSDGTLVGYPDYPPQLSLNIPAGLVGVVGIAMGRDAGLALKDDGTVTAFGDARQTYNLEEYVKTLSGVVAVTGNDQTFHAVKSDGTVISIGEFPVSGPDTVPRPSVVNGVIAISAGGFHTVALKRDGTVLAWGYNRRGECDVPAGLSDVIAVSAGGAGSLALKRDGTVVRWGRWASDSYARYVSGMSGVVAITAGSVNSLALCGLTTDEAPLIISPVAAVTNASGSGGSGVQFHYRITGTGTPTLFGASGLPPGLILNSVTGLITGVATQVGNFDVTLSATNTTGTTTRQLRIHVLGAPQYMAGLPATISSVSPSHQLYASNGPVQWQAAGLPPGLSLHATTGILSGTVQNPGTYAVTISMSNARGQTQHTASLEVPPLLQLGDYPYPLRVPAGMNRPAGAESTGVYPLVWDENGHVGQYANYGLPADLTGIVAVSAWTESYALALRGNGDVVAWRWNGPAPAPPELGFVAAVDTGGIQALALRSNGTVAAWKWNDWSQSQIPTTPASLGDVVAVAAGGSHSLALRSDGTVIAWGTNTAGQATVPGGLSDVIAIAAGWSHSLALRRNGTVVAWGSNDYGQRTVPAGLTNVAAITCGDEHCAALKSDGRVVAWGKNEYYKQATAPAGLAGVAAIAAGPGQTLVLSGRPGNVRPVIVSPRRALTSAAGTTGAGLQFHYRIAASGLPSSFFATGLPAGLTLNSSTGVISGVAADAGAWDITVGATNAAGTGTALLKLFVLGVPQILEPEVQINAVTAVQRQLYASASPSVWSATGMPDGLTLDPATGMLSGSVADPGVFKITLTVSNSRYTNTGGVRLLVVPARDTAQAAYALWREAHWKPAGTDNDPASDADGDGRNNLLEFALGTDPFVKDTDHYLRFLHNEEGRLELEVTVVQTAAAALLIRAQFSHDPYFGGSREDTPAIQPAVAEPPDKVRLRFVQPDTGAPDTRHFGRLVFTLPQ